MAGEFYVIKTGAENYFWERCREGNFTALMFDKPYYEAWAAGDTAAHLDVVRKNAKKGTPEIELKRRSTIWYNNGGTLRDSHGDIFLNRVGNNVYWATSTDASWFAIEHEYEGQPVVAVCKPVDKWVRHTAKDVPLQWPTIHNKAKDYLSPHRALFHITDVEMCGYLDALLSGDDLKPWHTQPMWKLKQGEDKGKSLGNSVPVVDFVVEDLMLKIKHTVDQANGQVVMSVKSMKNKELIDEVAVKAHLRQLYIDQDGRCKISGIPMHVPGQDNKNPDLMVSPDRIDSNGHYEVGNLQLVCRFINFWKCAADNSAFADLLDLVIEHRNVQAEAE